MRGLRGHAARRGAAGAAGARGVTSGTCLCRSPLTFLSHSVLCRSMRGPVTTCWAFSAQMGAPSFCTTASRFRCSGAMRWRLTVCCATVSPRGSSSAWTSSAPASSVLAAERPAGLRQGFAAGGLAPRGPRPPRTSRTSRPTPPPAQPPVAPAAPARRRRAAPQAAPRAQSTQRQPPTRRAPRPVAAVHHFVQREIKAQQLRLLQLCRRLCRRLFRQPLLDRHVVTPNT